MINHRRCSVLFFLILALQASNLSSTVVIEMDIPSMTQKSCSVIMGRVQKIEKDWVPAPSTPPGNKIVVATLAVKVQTVLKPCPHFQEGDTVKVKRMGGVIGEAGTIVPGAPSFKSNTEVLLFLSESSTGDHVITGFSQGKFRIITNAATGERTAVQDKRAGHLLLIDPHTGQPVSKKVPNRLPLQQLLEKLRSHDAQ